ncbi:hypothetical protein Tco_1343927 [Tanacetum coccineum]
MQNECSFHGLRSEDPNQHLKYFLELVDSLDLDVANRERTRLHLFQFLFTIKLAVGLNIFLQDPSPPGRILLLISLQTINQSAGDKLRDKNVKESWALLEDLALYDNENWNDLRDFAKPVKAISLPQDVPSTSDRRLIELENQVQCLMEAYLAPKSSVQVNKIVLHVRSAVVPKTLNNAWKILSKLLLIIHPRVLQKREASGSLSNLRKKNLSDTYNPSWKSHPNLRHRQRPATSLLIGRGFLATTNAIIESRNAKIAVGEGVTRSIFRVKEIDLGVEEVRILQKSQENSQSRTNTDTRRKRVYKSRGFDSRKDSEEEEPEAQGRKSQDDPLASLVQGLVTPSMTKVNASGEEQVEDISPNTLEAAKTLSRVASLKPKSIDKGRRYKRRKETKGKKVVSSLVFQEEVDTGAREVNIAEGVNTGSIKLSTVSEQVSTGSAKRSIPSPDKGQRAGKAPMISEETPKKSKEQILQEEASLAEAIRLDTLQKEEVAKQVHLDSLLAQRIAEEEELNEQQKKRRAQVQFEAQHYTDEDWDLIRAKIEANAELSKSMLGSDLQGEDFAKKMVDLGTWKLSQLKNLSFEEVKEEFDKLVKQVESFAPINFEATKASLKRFGEELQTKTTKKLKDDEAKDAEPAKKSGKRRKQMARKGLHTDLDKDDFEGSNEVNKQDDSVSGTKIPINHVLVAMKSPSIATYKIIKQGEKGVYQIVREDGTNIVYINFGAMLKDISRDDLTELYRIVMNRYGMDGPEDELEKVFWKYLKNMFEEPLSTDPIWSLLSQQRIISWRYYDSCRVHCLNLESMDIYMLIERKYPLSVEICKTMLNKKLQGGKPDEDCYKMLKMMEKQAGIRK